MVHSPNVPLRVARMEGRDSCRLRGLHRWCIFVLGEVWYLRSKTEGKGVGRSRKKEKGNR